MSQNKVYKSVTTNVEGRVLVIERVVNAPRSLVFQAFSDPEHLANWWGPRGWQTENRKFEFKPGGIWHYCMRCTDKKQGDFYGQESWGKAVYHEIIAPEKIVYTDIFADEEGQPVEGMPEIKITLNFIDEEGKTKIITRSEFASAEDLQRIVDMGAVQGFSSQFERLDDFLEELQ
jgi:uncharacterized protein YndB with AHSA1/START domain